MTPETITTISALLLASAGWLAFAREYRAHRETKASLRDEKLCLDTVLGKYTRLTDRDERGRFVKREGDA